MKIRKIIGHTSNFSDWQLKVLFNIAYSAPEREPEIFTYDDPLRSYRNLIIPIFRNKEHSIGL